MEELKKVKPVEASVESKHTTPVLKDGFVRFEKVSAGQYDYIDFKFPVDEITKNGMIEAGYKELEYTKKKEA